MNAPPVRRRRTAGAAAVSRFAPDGSAASAFRLRI